MKHRTIFERTDPTEVDRIKNDIARTTYRPEETLLDFIEDIHDNLEKPLPKPMPLLDQCEIETLSNGAFIEVKWPNFSEFQRYTFRDGYACFNLKSGKEIRVNVLFDGVGKGPKDVQVRLVQTNAN